MDSIDEETSSSSKQINIISMSIEMFIIKLQQKSSPALYTYG